MVDIKNEKIETLGGWQTPADRERMIKWFNQLKGQGRFRRFKDYFQWEKATYGGKNKSHI